ncbi:MAG: HipA domain-containing protein [Proteobacteria bacterium]|nr:HipA domain-containing protein [Pseudomonadota bacterium]
MILQQGAQAAADLEQLWRRIAFFVCVSNTDDHLRNHGFMLARTGWALAPAYDMNPDPNGEGLKLNISESDNAQDLELVLEMAPYYHVKKARVKAILKEVVGAVKTWREVASVTGISRASQHQVERAFRVAEERGC